MNRLHYKSISETLWGNVFIFGTTFILTQANTLSNTLCGQRFKDVFVAQIKYTQFWGNVWIIRFFPNVHLYIGINYFDSICLYCCHYKQGNAPSLPVWWGATDNPSRPSITTTIICSARWLRWWHCLQLSSHHVTNIFNQCSDLWVKTATRSLEIIHWNRPCWYSDEGLWHQQTHLQHRLWFGFLFITSSELLWIINATELRHTEKIYITIRQL